MAITKPPVLPAWADAGDKVQPSNAELSVGWPVSSTPPSRQRFNWVLNYVANAVRYFSRRGLVDYDAAETYMTGDRIIGDDGKTYRSLIDNNTAQTPSTSPTKWERWGFSLADLGVNAQTQPYTAFTTTGATGAFVLTPSPALTAYAANQRFRVKFHVAGNGADNMNISALGNKSLKQYDSTGAKVAAVIAANQLVDVEYDGVDLVVLDPLPPAASASIQGTFKNLNVSTTGLNASVTVSADEILAKDATGNAKLLSTVALSINTAAAGANGLDTGVVAVNTWYSVWAIWNGVTVAGLVSASTTAPTMPGGYTHKARIGWIRTEGGANKYPLPIIQKGDRVAYSAATGTNLTSPPQMASGTSVASNTPVAVAPFVPPTARMISIRLMGNNIVGPGNSLAYGTNLTYSKIYFSGENSGQGGNYYDSDDSLIEGANVYWSCVSSGTTALICAGWQDNF